MTNVAALPEHFDIVLARGAEHTYEALITNKVTGAPRDITNDIVRLVVEEKHVGHADILELENGVGGHESPAAGTTRFTFLQAFTAGKYTSKYVIVAHPFSVEWIPAAGEPDTLIEGVVIFNPFARKG